MKDEDEQPRLRDCLNANDLVPSPMDDLRHQLRQVFSSEGAIDEWLDSPDRSLDWLSPRVLASQPDGMQRVRDLIERMINGIP